MIITNELLLILADDDYVFLVCVLFDSGLCIYMLRVTRSTALKEDNQRSPYGADQGEQFAIGIALELMADAWLHLVGLHHVLEIDFIRV